MNTTRTMLRAAFVAATVLATAVSASAGGQRHVMPADYGQTHPAYAFKVVGAPSAATPLTVQLVNAATGQPATDANVTMQHRRWLGVKGVPQFQYVQLALTPDGRGDYVCQNGPLFASEKIVLRAQVPGESSVTWLTVAANN